MDGNIVEFSNVVYDYGYLFGGLPVINECRDENILFLYIRFNTPLNPKSINSKTTCVADSDSNILKSAISYDKHNNTIVIKPLKPFSENKHYYLIITKYIQSLGGNSLSESVQIKFNVTDNRVSSFSILRGREVLNQMIGGRKKLANGVAESLISDSPPVKRLRFVRHYLEFFLMIVSIFIVLASFIYSFTTSFTFGIVFFVSILVRYCFNFFSVREKSMEMYNIGVKKFNSYLFEDSIDCFENALLIDSSNILAQKAVDIAYEKLIESYFNS